jgi:hypothetical protein
VASTRLVFDDAAIQAPRHHAAADGAPAGGGGADQPGDQRRVIDLAAVVRVIALQPGFPG